MNFSGLLLLCMLAATQETNSTVGLLHRVDDQTLKSWHTPHANLDNTLLGKRPRRVRASVYAVVIIGGGAAGIAAAKVLHEAGVKFLLLEAEPALGGRMKKASFGGVTIELGANWIHGPWAHQESSGQVDLNPLWDLKMKYGVRGNFTDYRSARLSTRTGAHVKTRIVNKWWNRIENVIEFCESKAEALWDKAEKQDLIVPESIDISVEKCFNEYGYMEPGISRAEKDVAEMFEWEHVDLDYTDRPQRMSTMWAFPTNGDYLDKDFLVTDQRGYSVLLDNVADAFRNQIRLSQPVIKVHYSNNRIVVTTRDGSQVRAMYAICTLPLGALQHRTVLFEPPFPRDKLAGIDGMKMGKYAKVNVQFPYNFWGDKEVLIVVGEPLGFLTWGLNLDLPKYIPGSRMISFHFAGDVAVQVETQPTEVTKARLVKELRRIYGRGTPDPLNILVTNWTHDPWTFGSYSDWPIGYTESARARMTQNEGPLYFAGEHTAGQLFGLVHGAYESGIHAAEKILGHLRPMRSSYI